MTTTRKTILWKIAVAGGLALAAVLTLELGSATPSSPAAVATATQRAATDDDVLAVRAELAQLRSEVRQRAIAVPHAAGRPAAADPVDDSPFVRDRDQARERERVIVAAITDQLGDIMATETADVVWARDTEAAVRDTIAAPEYAGLTVEQVECRATLCRLLLATPDDRAHTEELLGDLTAVGPFANGGFVDLGVDGEPTAMFIARAGHPLPPPPRVE